MKTKLLLSGAVALVLATPAFAQTDLTAPPAGYAGSSGLDETIPEDKPAAQAPAATGDAVLDRLNALEARLRQVEARNAELEAAAQETQTRVEKVEVRAATAVQAGPAPTFSDVGGNFTFKPRGTFQIDYAAYNTRSGGYDFNNGTDIRRARFGFDGTFYKTFKYRIEAEYVKNAVNLLDAYVQYTGFKKLTFTVGQHKAPYGLEANSTDALNSFLERGMANTAFGAVGAERRVGLSVAYVTDKITAQVGVFGAGEAIQRNSAKPSESFGFNGRLTWEPINDGDHVVHVGASAYRTTGFVTTGSAPTATAAASAPVKDRVTLSDRPDTRVDGGNIESLNVDGVKDATYVGAEAALVYKRFSLQGEYNRLHLDRFAGTAATGSGTARITGASPTFDGFYVFGSIFLTGEARQFKGGVVDRIKPFNNFNPAAGQWGAFELLARYDTLNLTDRSYSVLSRKAESFTGGLSWYLNPNVKVLFNYIRFKGTNSPLVVAPISTFGTTARGDAFASRVQVDF